ncbi:hypothetical protein Tco_0215878 [Tanacetum coccineum]
MAWLPICGELCSASNFVHWEPMFILYCNRSIGEDYRLGRAINSVAMEVDNVVNPRALFIEELDSLGVRHVPAKFAEFLKDIQAKDRETVANLQILCLIDESRSHVFLFIGCMSWFSGWAEVQIRRVWLVAVEAHPQLSINLFTGYVVYFSMVLSDKLKVLMLLRLIRYFVATEFVTVEHKQAESTYLKDKMKFWFTRARTEDQVFIMLMRDVSLELKIRMHKTRRLIAELRVLGEVGDAVTSLNHMREIVGHESAKLAILEQLSTSTDVAMRLKDAYVTDME